MRWFKKAKAGRLEPEPGAKSALCMAQMSNVLGCARIPRKDRDEFVRYTDSTHIVVQRHGRFIPVEVVGADGSIVAEEELAAALKVLQDPQWSAKFKDADEFGLADIGVLSSGDRDEWAQQRLALEENPETAAALKRIDSAILMVALDDALPNNNPTDVSRNALHASASTSGDRWWDKHQLIVTACGSLSMNFEHSSSDGMTWNRWLTETWADLKGQPPPLDWSPLSDFDAPLKSRVGVGNLEPLRYYFGVTTKLRLISFLTKLSPYRLHGNQLICDSIMKAKSILQTELIDVRVYFHMKFMLLTVFMLLLISFRDWTLKPWISQNLVKTQLRNGNSAPML